MRTRWEDYITNEEVLPQAGLPGVEVIIAKHHLCWSGHIIWVP